MKKGFLSFGLAGLAAVSIGLVSSIPAQGAKLKVAFIYIGPPGDYGWTYAHEQGRLALQKALPDVETIKVENVPESQAGPFLDQVVKEGAKVVFTTSFGYMDPTLEAAKKYPDVIFAHATGFKRAPNLATYMIDLYQMYYLNGMIAGALSKTNKLGYVAAFPIPEVKRDINAFTLGARATNPKATVNVTWINAWFEPNKAKEATEALLADGADAFAFHEDTPTVIQTAAAKGAIGFSHNSPMQKFAPKAVPSGQLSDWSLFYIDFIKKVQAGTYTNKNLGDVDNWGRMSEGGAQLGGEYGVPINPEFVDALKAKKVGAQSVYDLVLARMKQMSAKGGPTFEPFTGPIKDRNGVLRVPDKKSLTQAELLSMEWAAPGVVGPWANEPK
jgi:simple sugar transport system substrate-binding protein